MRGATALLCGLGCASTAAAQSLLAAISVYPQLSTFAALLQNNSNVAGQLFSGSAGSPQTLLIPSNAAFTDYQSRTGLSIGSLSASDLQLTLSYHVLVGSLGAADFTQPQGLTAPSLLVGQQYDNRTGGAGLSSIGGTSGSTDGQVVFIAPKSGGASNSSAGLATVESGLGNMVNLMALNGTWMGGRFHMIDGFLTLPQVCTQTIRSNGLTSLDLSLNRTGLAPVLDHINNVTCLAPSDAAFRAAGNPDSGLNASDLTQALLFHTIPMPLYSNFLVHGQTFQTANNQTVRISIINGQIYFNDAMVIKSNVITNNGLIHQLNKIMSPLTSNLSIPATSSSQATPSSTGTSTGTGTGNATSTAKGTSAATSTMSGASSDNSPPESWGITGLLGAALLFFL